MGQYMQTLIHGREPLINSLFPVEILLTVLRRLRYNKQMEEKEGSFFFFSFGSTAQFRPWPPPRNFPFHFSY
jgi:hypothetical protein